MMRALRRVVVFPQPAWVYEPSWTDGMWRANGECLCHCGEDYNHHPTHPDWPEIPTLVVTCDGEPVKT